MSGKTCNGCKIFLPLEEFYRHATAPQGRATLCKRCLRPIGPRPKPDREALALLCQKILSKCVPWRNGCILWTGAKIRTGYGRIVYKRFQYATHRIVFAALSGEIPEGLELDHLCRTRECINPHHLEPVMHAENVRRAHAVKTHCKRGHARIPENVYRGKNNSYCRPCKRERKNDVRFAQVASGAP